MPEARRPEFRRRALVLVGVGEPVAQISKGLETNEQRLPRWMAIDAVDSARVEGLTGAEKRELIELHRETGVLEMKNEIFKPTSAYFARTNILPK